MVAGSCKVVLVYRSQVVITMVNGELRLQRGLNWVLDCRLEVDSVGFAPVVKIQRIRLVLNLHFPVFASIMMKLPENGLTLAVMKTAMTIIITPLLKQAMILNQAIQTTMEQIAKTTGIPSTIIRT